MLWARRRVLARLARSGCPVGHLYSSLPGRWRLAPRDTTTSLGRWAGKPGARHSDYCAAVCMSSPSANCVQRHWAARGALTERSDAPLHYACGQARYCAGAHPKHSAQQSLVSGMQRPTQRPSSGNVAAPASDSLRCSPSFGLHLAQLQLCAPRQRQHLLVDCSPVDHPRHPRRKPPPRRRVQKLHHALPH